MTKKKDKSKVAIGDVFLDKKVGVHLRVEEIGKKVWCVGRLGVKGRYTAMMEPYTRKFLLEECERVR